MAEIIAEIFDDHKTDALKVKWYRGSAAQRPYRVRRQRVLDAAKGVRDALQDLVLGHKAKEGDRKEKYDYDPGLMRKLAEQGYEFYKALFLGIDEDDRRHAERAKDWVAGRPLEDTITFTVPSRVHVPWGLIYDERVSQDSQIDRKRFWCLKHATGAHYFDSRPEWIDVGWEAEDFGILFGAHEEPWSEVYGSHHRESPELQRLHRLLSYPDQPRFCLKEIYGLWEETKNNRPPGLLCFYCHGTGKELNIGIDVLSALKFEEKFARLELKDRPPTLVFLAACQTVIGSLDLDVEFLTATSGPGFCGCIGTEVKVPNLFALRFLSLFIDRLFASGKSVREVMSELREEHWPLSLVFSVCCAGELRLAPSKAVTLEKDDVNFS